jgi:hypothetical protein
MGFGMFQKIATAFPDVDFQNPEMTYLADFRSSSHLRKYASLAARSAASRSSLLPPMNGMSAISGRLPNLTSTSITLPFRKTFRTTFVSGFI